MNIIVCLDDQYGMMFNARRQSRDRILCEKLLEIVADHKLWVSKYTAQLFPAMDGICISENLFSDAGENDYCFVEDAEIEALLSKAHRVIMFCWNRVYPADVFFPVDILENCFTRVKREDFPGSSHKTITMEEYVRI